MGFQRHHNTFEENLSAGMGLVLGLLFLAGGFWVRIHTAHQQASLIETQGTVVDSVSRRDHNNNETRETYAPVVEFVVRNERLRFTGFYDSSRLSTGRTVAVRYDPEKPVETARIIDPLEGLVPWGMYGIGSVAVVSSVGALLPVRWSSQKQS